MHCDRGSPYRDAARERQRARHPRASGDPALGHPLDSRGSLPSTLIGGGHDHPRVRTGYLHARVHNTL
jgi:hypothetical protein